MQEQPCYHGSKMALHLKPLLTPKPWEAWLLGSVSEGLTKALEKVPISFHPSEERRLASAATGRS